MAQQALSERLTNTILPIPATVCPFTQTNNPIPNQFSFTQQPSSLTLWDLSLSACPPPYVYSTHPHWLVRLPKHNTVEFMPWVPRFSKPTCGRRASPRVERCCVCETNAHTSSSLLGCRTRQTGVFPFFLPQKKHTQTRTHRWIWQWGVLGFGGGECGAWDMSGEEWVSGNGRGRSCTAYPQADLQKTRNMESKNEKKGEIWKKRW